MGPQATLRALIAIVFFTYIGQNLLNTSLAPVGRAMSLPEWVLGATISLAAFMVMMLSQRWGRLSLTWGRRPVLLSALTLATVAGYLFALTAWAATAKIISPTFAAIGIITARGLFFGAAVAAIPPTGQALIASITSGERARIKGMARFGASINLSIMVGSLLSALLAAVTLMLPVYTTPVMVTIALVLAYFLIPITEAASRVKSAPKLSPTDRRILPFLVCGFGLFFTFGANQILLGFVIQDRFNMPANLVVTYTGLLLLIQAGLALFSQAVLASRLNVSPLTLMRWGLVCGLAGLALIALPLGSLIYLGAGNALLGCALGLFGPGYNAGASLMVSASEQGGVAGLLSATNASTWVIAPLLSTGVYGAHPYLPFIIAATLLAISTLVAFIPRSLRRTIVKIRSTPPPLPR